MAQTTEVIPERSAAQSKDPVERLATRRYNPL
jgi:hypothetical protein